MSYHKAANPNFVFVVYKSGHSKKNWKYTIFMQYSEPFSSIPGDKHCCFNALVNISTSIPEPTPNLRIGVFLDRQIISELVYD